MKRNSASSRAIPIAKVIEQVRYDHARPIHWGKNQPGMTASEELTGPAADIVKNEWMMAAWDAADRAANMDKAGAHKQVANRVLEPYQWMKTVLTATEFDNFFHLRRHPDADPNIAALAECMWQAIQEAPVVDLEPGDWHVPYFGDGYWLKDCGVPLEDALAISSSCCAQTSFRTTDDTLEKARRIFERLVESKPVHASPFEHQATPMYEPKFFCGDCQQAPDWEDGVTHADRNGFFWSGNLIGWIQHRQLIPDNTCWNYEEQL